MLILLVDQDSLSGLNVITSASNGNSNIPSELNYFTYSHGLTISLISVNSPRTVNASQVENPEDLSIGMLCFL